MNNSKLIYIHWALGTKQKLESKKKHAGNNTWKRRALKCRNICRIRGKWREKSTQKTESQYRNITGDTDEFSSPSHRRTHAGRCCCCTGSKDRDHSWVWTRLLCAHRSERAAPLRDTITYSHTLKKLSTHLHKGQFLRQSRSLAQIYGSEWELNLAPTQTPCTLYLESQFSSCAIYTRQDINKAKWWSDFFLSSWQKHVHFCTIPIYNYIFLLLSTSCEENSVPDEGLKSF